MKTSTTGKSSGSLREDLGTSVRFMLGGGALTLLGIELLVFSPIRAIVRRLEGDLEPEGEEPPRIPPKEIPAVLKESFHRAVNRQRRKNDAETRPNPGRDPSTGG